MSSVKGPVFITYPSDGKPVRFYKSPLEEADGEPDCDWICVEDVHALTGLSVEVLKMTIEHNAFIDDSYPVNLFQKIQTESGVVHISPLATAASLMEDAVSAGYMSHEVVEVFLLQYTGYWNVKHADLGVSKFNALNKKVAARWAALEFEHGKLTDQVTIN